MLTLKDLQEVADFAGTSFSFTGFKRKLVNVPDVISVLRVMFQKERHPLSLQEIVSRTGIWITTTLRICIKLEELGLIKVENGKVRLTRKGETFVQDTLKLHPVKSCKCTFCGGFGIQPKKEYIRIATKIRTERKELPFTYVDMAQLPSTLDTMVRRITLLAEMGDLEGKKIIFLGDDDLLSVSVAMTGLPDKVAVFEIDPRYTDFFEKVSKKYSLNIDAITGDLRDPLPNNIVGSQDVFFASPPSDAQYQKLFISRGVEMLKRELGKVGYFNTSLYVRTSEENLEIERSLTDMGLIITHIFPNLNQYHFIQLVPSIDLKPKEIDRFYIDKNSLGGLAMSIRFVTTEQTKSIFYELGPLLKVYQNAEY